MSKNHIADFDRLNIKFQICNLDETRFYDVYEIDGRTGELTIADDEGLRKVVNACGTYKCTCGKNEYMVSKETSETLKLIHDARGVGKYAGYFFKVKPDIEEYLIREMGYKKAPAGALGPLTFAKYKSPDHTAPGGYDRDLLYICSNTYSDKHVVYYNAYYINSNAQTQVVQVEPWRIEHIPDDRLDLLVKTYATLTE